MTEKKEEIKELLARGLAGSGAETRACLTAMAGIADRLKNQINAWNKVFGTSQLTHAEAKLKALEDERDRLKAEVEKAEEALAVAVEALYRSDTLIEKARNGGNIKDEAGPVRDGNHDALAKIARMKEEK